MATKMKLLKMMQEDKGLAQITNRRPAPRPPVLYLMQLREQKPVSPDIPKRRLVVSAESADPSTVSFTIRINHINMGDSPLPIVIG